MRLRVTLNSSSSCLFLPMSSWKASMQTRTPHSTSYTMTNCDNPNVLCKENGWTTGIVATLWAHENWLFVVKRWILHRLRRGSQAQEYSAHRMEPTQAGVVTSECWWHRQLQSERKCMQACWMCILSVRYPWGQQIARNVRQGLK